MSFLCVLLLLGPEGELEKVWFIAILVIFMLMMILCTLWVVWAKRKLQEENRQTALGMVRHIHIYITYTYKRIFLECYKFCLVKCRYFQLF